MGANALELATLNAIRRETLQNFIIEFTTPWKTSRIMLIAQVVISTVVPRQSATDDPQRSVEDMGETQTQISEQRWG